MPEMATGTVDATVPRGRILGAKARATIWAHYVGHPVGRDATVLTVGTVALGPKSEALFLGLVSGPDMGLAGEGGAPAEQSTRDGPILPGKPFRHKHPPGEKAVPEAA